MAAKRTRAAALQYFQIYASGRSDDDPPAHAVPLIWDLLVALGRLEPLTNKGGEAVCLLQEGWCPGDALRRRPPVVQIEIRHANHLVEYYSKSRRAYVWAPGYVLVVDGVVQHPPMRYQDAHLTKRKMQP